MKFEREEYSESLIEEMRPLWQEHYNEIALYKDIPLNPNLLVYAGCAAAETLRIFTARDSSRLVGYQIFFVSPHPHYQQSIHAVQDIVYLSQAVRQGMNGYRFIKWCDDQLQKEGVQVVNQHIKAAHDFGVLLRRMGYRLQDLIYTRRLN